MAMRSEAITAKLEKTTFSEPAGVLLSHYWASSLHTGLKRILDIVFSSILILLAMPLMAVTAIAIKIDSAGPVFYRWLVVGKGGFPFRSWKFRSMCVDADEKKRQLMARNEMQGPVFKLTDDPRVTRVGRVLRRYSLDELPQLFSVLIGDMALVGPRPPLQAEYAKFSAAQKRKLAVKPGMTCLWQVSGRNDISDFDEWVTLDLEYIRSWSLWLDTRILWMTLLTVVRGTGR
jgi:lipopolysaccharide/colanic/teichoic acid biosynthesis glycosyltransferase